MGQAEVLLTFVDLFRRLKIKYLLTGSIAVGVYGYPRATHDIDFVIAISGDEKKKLIKAFKFLDETYSFDKSVLKTSKSPIKQFDIYHIESGIKIDFWILAAKNFTDQYSRRQEVAMHKRKIYLTSPEDIILTKLSWCYEVFSERHFRDCVGIVKVQGKKLDRVYLTRQAAIRKIRKLLKEVFSAKTY